MTIKKLPGAPEGRVQAGVSSQILPRALDRWNPGIQAATDTTESDRTISVYDVIGQDYWTGEGVTAKRVAGALRGMGKGPVTVNVNSPGGDMFEGLAIYNLLREHDGEVTVKVLGLAASAASVIAMAGDTVQIARAGFLMIHNAWVVAVGNRNDLREYADTLEPFDRAMADIYAAHTGQDPKAMAKLMDKESWIGGSDAVENGFADELLPSDQVEQSKGKANASAVRRIEAALRASGMPKSEAMRLISEMKGKAPEAESVQPEREQVAGLVEMLRGFHLETQDAPQAMVDLNDTERKFLEEMIPHHEMAIESARAAYPDVESAEVKGLVESIIAAQSGEIALMETWLDNGQDSPAAKKKKKKRMPMKMSDSKSSAGDPAGGGEGDPTGHGSDAGNTEQAVLAALETFNAI